MQKFYRGFFDIAGKKQTIYYSLYDWQTNHLNGEEITEQEFNKLTNPK